MSILDQILIDAQKRERDDIQAEAERRGVPIETIKKERAQTQADREAESRRREAQWEAHRRTIMDNEQCRRQTYGDKLGLGVPAHNGVVINKGGLTERSDGNGVAGNTVVHVVLDGDLDLGRLHRLSGDLLCKPASKLGRRSIGISGTDRDHWEPGFLYTSWEEGVVTCKTCLKKLEFLRPKD